MGKRIEILAGIALLVAGFLLFRFAFVTEEDDAMASPPSPAGQMVPGQNREADFGQATAGTQNQEPRFGDVDEVNRPKSGASGSTSMTPGTRATHEDAVEQTREKVTQTQPERDPHDMPPLSVLQSDSVGPGPEQVDHGGAGPEFGARDLADAGRSTRPSEAGPGAIGTQAGDDLLNAGPSQVDLGFSGPGVESPRSVESSESDVIATEDELKGEPLPVD